MQAGWISVDPATGRVKSDTTTAVAVIFNILSIGGVNTAQSGSVTDSRFLLGDPFVTVLEGNFFNSRSNYKPTISVSGSTLTWTYPQADSSVDYYRPNITFVYGVR